jgi:hypothetical protein
MTTAVKQAKALSNAEISLRDETFSSFKEWIRETDRNFSSCSEWKAIVKDCGIKMGFIRNNKFEVFVELNKLFQINSR